MNNEPVAWMYKVNDTYTIFNTIKPPDDAYDEGSLIPLYTHPAKTLTDEEIEDLIDSEIPMILLGGRLFYRQFARAILRKAQEK